MQKKVKWITLVIALVVFTFGTYLFSSSPEEKLTFEPDSAPERKAKPVDMEDLPVQWEEAESLDEISRFYERRIPSLQLAREKNLTTSPQKSTTVPNLDGRMQINEIFHSGETIYYLYSLDLSLLVPKESQSGSYTPPQVSQVFLQQAGQVENQTLPASGTLGFSDAKIFENRLYGFLESDSISQTPERSLSEEIPTSLQLYVNGTMYRSTPVPVAYRYDQASQILQTLTFDDSYKRGGLTITPLEVEFSVDTNHILLYVEDENRAFDQIVDARMQTGDGQFLPLSPYLHATEEGQNVYKGYFRPLRQVPEQLSFTIRDLYLREPVPFSFSLDLPDLTQGATVLLDEKVGEVIDTSVIVDSFTYEPEHGLDIQVNYRPQALRQPEKMAGIPLSDSNEASSLVTFETDLNTSGSVEYSGGMNLSSGLFIPTSSLEGASRIEITFHEIAIAKRINQTFTLDSDNS
ncbi:hypothetical protein EQV77_15540 [Halobacillus fulvus]|nr:hypothetical protein EQV77_15540 [Halobacillus fulvus]